jgi:hypothetical protein
MSLFAFWRYLFTRQPTAQLAPQFADVRTARTRIEQQRARGRS